MDLEKMVVEYEFWVNYFLKMFSDMSFISPPIFKSRPLTEWKWVLQCYRILEFA